MGKTGVLGAFEELVLLAVVRGGDDAYAVTVRRDLEEATGSSVSVGSVYATLDRLEEKGLVASDVRRVERAIGRPRRCYRLSDAGRAALAETRSIRATMWRGVRLPDGKGTTS